MFIWEQSSTYRRVLEKGREQGLKEAREQVQQEVIRMLRETIQEVVAAKFGKVPRSFRKQVNTLNDLAALKAVLIGVAVAESLKQL